MNGITSARYTEAAVQVSRQ